MKQRREPSRRKETAEGLENARQRMVAKGETAPFYESDYLNPFIEKHPPGFRDTHKAIHEWKRLKRRVKKSELENHKAWIASWWQPMGGSVTIWCRVWAFEQTEPLPRSPEGLREKLQSGKNLTVSEAKILNSHDWSL